MSKKIIVNLESIWDEYSEYSAEECENNLDEMKRDFLVTLSEYSDVIDDSEFDYILENLEYSNNLNEWNQQLDELFEWANYNNVKIKI